jgi:hypothetical protein
MSLPANLERVKQDAEGMKIRLQQDIGNWEPLACSCVSINSDSCASTFFRLSDVEVGYFGTTCTFQLSLFKWQCLGCSQTHSPSPL